MTEPIFTTRPLLSLYRILFEVMRYVVFLPRRDPPRPSLPQPRSAGR